MIIRSARTKNRFLSAGILLSLLLSGCSGAGTASGLSASADGSVPSVQIQESVPAGNSVLPAGSQDDGSASSLPQAPSQQAPAPQAPQAPSQQASAPQAPQAPSQQASAPQNSSQGEIDSDTAFALALQNAGVPEGDAFDVEIERDRENDIPIYQVEFETQYGDYDFEIAVSDGRIVGADYEVDEEWLDSLGGSPVSMDEARAKVQAKVPGSSAEDVQIRNEEEDGRGRYEGELFHGGIKYKFEIDPLTGIIYDWNADLRE